MGTKQGLPINHDRTAKVREDTKDTPVSRNQLSPVDFVRLIESRFDSEDTQSHTLALLAPKVLFPPTKKDFPNVDVLVSTTDTAEDYKLNALIDSGATGLYVDHKWLEEKKIHSTPLEFPFHVYNADGSSNSNGKITHKVELRFEIQGHTTKGWFHVVDLGNKKMIIGMTWL
jgi:hypothetical protein